MTTDRPRTMQERVLRARTAAWDAVQGQTGTDEHAEALLRCFEEELRAAVEEEREACAGILEYLCTWIPQDIDDGLSKLLSRIAAAIRARGKAEANHG